MMRRSIAPQLISGHLIKRKVAAEPISLIRRQGTEAAAWEKKMHATSRGYTSLLVFGTLVYGLFFVGSKHLDNFPNSAPMESNTAFSVAP